MINFETFIACVNITTRKLQKVIKGLKIVKKLRKYYLKNIREECWRLSNPSISLGDTEVPVIEKEGLFHHDIYLGLFFKTFLERKI